MLDRARLLKDLQALLRQIEADLLERSESMTAVRDWLVQEYAQAQQSNRTAMSFEDWRSGQITHVGAAWVLSAVFARFLEDNGLVKVPKISGPVGKALDRARDEHEVYFRSHPQETDREYLLAVFRELGALPGMGAIFLDYSPVFERENWLSGDAAGLLLQFFQKVDAATGALVHDFTDPEWDTRFLGDLYQDLSEAARKRYALLQTPIFVEEFILDRTLDPAIDAFGLADLRMIDPACGSGHFLLGAFERILDRWQRLEPGTNVRVLAQRSLDSVHGVDVNPYAIAIARFRLLLAAMRASGIERLVDAPGFKFRLACGDSLLHGEGSQLVLGDWAPMAHHFQSEDIRALNGILKSGHYHAVVANPPYIVPRDKALNAAYRERYKACHRQYSLAVPFMERIFGLVVKGGFTGQITANSFMKREFGKKLIEVFFPKVDLTHVIDTSGAYIPGHGTPTVILFGKNQLPVANVIRTVMGIRGEPSTPIDAAQGLVWSAITEQIDIEGSESEFVSVADSQRELFHKHPWSIGGGGATELKDFLNKYADTNLESLIAEIGRTTHTGEDNVFYMSPSVAATNGLTKETVPLVLGENLRDYQLDFDLVSLFPYDKDNGRVLEVLPKTLQCHFWRYRVVLKNRQDFGQTIEERGLKWFEHSMFFANRFKNPSSIAFAFVATHNHFVLDRGGKVFNRSAPVIKLPAGATEDEHLALLGLLNSSIACFWMKQVFFPKGGDQVGNEGARIRKTWWDERYEFAGTGLQSFPLAQSYPNTCSQTLDNLASLLIANSPEVLLQGGTHNLRDRLTNSRSTWEKTLSQMISQQEELDWECYRLYQLIDDDLTYSNEIPPLHLGQRSFEIIMARQIEVGNLETAWFERHNSIPITELPAEWPDDYKKIVERRIQLIETNKNICLIEQPEYKRRWNTESWDSQLQRALETWLLNRLESYFDFDGRMSDENQPTAKIIDPALISTAKLTDIARQDPDFLQVGELYRNDPTFDVQNLIDELIDKETVPILPILRYKPSGLRKRTAWEQTWELQRQEDAIDARTKLPKDHPDHLNLDQAKTRKLEEIGPIPVPPKYATSDFLKTHYWKLRGKLDVPKERWVSFPHCEGPDGLPVIAWAGYNHLQLTQAITTYYIYIQETVGGSEDPRLIPLLASLLELLPWLHQYHSDIDPEYGYSLSAYYQDFLLEETRRLGHTPDTLKQWEPPKRTAKRKR